MIVGNKVSSCFDKWWLCLSLIYKFCNLKVYVTIKHKIFYKHLYAVLSDFTTIALKKFGRKSNPPHDGTKAGYIVKKSFKTFSPIFGFNFITIIFFFNLITVAANAKSYLCSTDSIKVANSKMTSQTNIVQWCWYTSIFFFFNFSYVPIPWPWNIFHFKQLHFSFGKKLRGHIFACIHLYYSQVTVDVSRHLKLQ